ERSRIPIPAAAEEPQLHRWVASSNSVEEPSPHRSRLSTWGMQTGGAFQSSSHAANLPRSSATCSGVSEEVPQLAKSFSKKVTSTGPSGKASADSPSCTTPDLYVPGIVSNMNLFSKN